MNEHSGDAFEGYYSDAASWNRDRLQAIYSSRRIAWWVAAVAAAIALFEALALVALMPLKTLVPYTLMVDRTTGYVQALKPLDQEAISPDAALTQSFLVQYILAREGFDVSTLKADYQKVALFSADAARRSYLTAIQTSNPESPLQLYPRNTIVDARVKSISPIGARTVLIRFDTIRTDAGAPAQAPKPWVAVVRYRYSNLPMSLESRFVNPLGFQVTSYRRDAEALPVGDDVSHASSPSPNAYYRPVAQSDGASQGSSE